ncbi:NAD(P)/FAD-dependent oxidoreductase [Pseudomonas monteilii]|uniref:NAD(P)/FAD-dependent oxidoreductase n=1 Tax=Pseudomonas monteilii TaxID=76759 RepID=UPI003D9572E7
MFMHIVIVGGGAGGLELATGLGRRFRRSKNVKVTLIDAKPTHVWKPLLHEVAAGSLNTSEHEVNYVAQANWNHFAFQLGRLAGIDRGRKNIQLDAVVDDQNTILIPARSIRYDRLVVAIGSRTNDFNTPGAAEHCHFLDSTAQAESFHRHLLNLYLRAHAAAPCARPQKISVVIVGAGATGVELAAELRNSAIEFLAYGLSGIPPEQMTITVVEAGSRILPALSERTSRSVHDALSKIDVDVMVNTKVSQVSAGGLATHTGALIAADLMVWAAGVRGPEVLQNFGGLECNRSNQLVVRPTLQTTMDDSIYAIGDCAACSLGENLGNVPPRAQSAHQQASLLVKSFTEQVRGAPPLAYRHKDHGSLVSLSHFTAVGHLMGSVLRNMNVEGRLARWIYSSLYRLHQVALFGWTRTALRILSERLARSTRTRLKLH